MNARKEPTKEWIRNAVEDESERHSFQLYVITHPQEFLDELAEAREALVRGEAIRLRDLEDAISRAHARDSQPSTEAEA